MLNPNSLAAAVLADPAASYALKDAIKSVVLARDAVDALNDAETLRAIAKDHLAWATGRGAPSVRERY